MRVFVLVLLLIFETSVVCAGESNCHAIRNSDTRNHCLALVKPQDSYCYSVQESDTKNLCLAQVKRQANYCHSISSADAKNFCLATVRWVGGESGRNQPVAQAICHSFSKIVFGKIASQIISLGFCLKELTTLPSPSSPENWRIQVVALVLSAQL